MKKNLRVFLKTLILLLLLAIVYWLLQPAGALGKVSLYNSIFPGRERFPFGETPRTAYNFSLNNLNAMFAAHEISGSPKTADKLRVVVIGDSSTWGTLLRPEETLAGQLDGRTIPTADGTKRLEVFNLGYPTLSLTKDVLLLNRAMAYQPDVILWLTTMESFPADKQTASPLAEKNLEELRAVFTSQNEQPDWLGAQPVSETQTLWRKRTIVAQRRELADLIRLQLYGVMWAATGIDQDYPADYPAPQLDLAADDTFHGVAGVYPAELTAWDALDTGMQIGKSARVLLVNEPILISDGENSDIRYNFYYPRRAYDAWRGQLAERCALNGWHCLDLWNLLSTNAFTNSAIHYNSSGSQKIADEIMKTLTEMMR